MASFPNLESINFSTNNQVNNRVLADISQHCKNLKYLNIRCCRNITDEGIGSLAELPHLEELVVNDVPTIAGNYLWTLSKLKRLECEGCERINDDSIIKLMRNVLGLEFLNLKYALIISANILEAANEIQSHRQTALHISVSQFVTSTWYETNISHLLIIRDDEDAHRWNRDFF